MIYIYRLLFLPIFVCIFPYYLKRMLRRGGYLKNIKSRFGFFGALSPKQKKVKRIWIQAVSVGELNAIRPIIETLLQDSTLELILTCTTTTGYKLLEERYSSKALKVGFFPLDFWPFSLMAWEKLKPDLMLLTEGDLWPEHLTQASTHNVPILLLNGRISDRSFKRYTVAKWATKWLFCKLSAVFAATVEDSHRFVTLGANPQSVYYYGNLKYDSVLPKILSLEEKKHLKAHLGFTDRTVLLGASTWEGEEKCLIEFLKIAQSKGLNVGLLLIPRHPERKKELEKLLKSSVLTWHLHSSKTPCPKRIDIYLVDTIGQLQTLAQAADFAFIGKSMPWHQGGQNLVEMVSLLIPVVYGPNMSNFREACQALENLGGARKVHFIEELHSALLNIVEKPVLQKEMAKACQKWKESNQAITQNTITALRSYIN